MAIESASLITIRTIVLALTVNHRLVRRKSFNVDDVASKTDAVTDLYHDRVLLNCIIMICVALRRFIVLCFLLVDVGMQGVRLEPPELQVRGMLFGHAILDRFANRLRSSIK